MLDIPVAALTSGNQIASQLPLPSNLPQRRTHIPDPPSKRKKSWSHWSDYWLISFTVKNLYPFLCFLPFSMQAKVNWLVIVHLKRHMNFVIWPNLGWLWSSKMSCKGALVHLVRFRSLDLDQRCKGYGLLKFFISLSKKKSPNVFSIYVQAMEILSTHILTLTRVTNPPYHQTISCSD
jgi:hypothetical protein